MKQIWNSVVIEANIVALLLYHRAVAILKQRQKRFRVRYLEYSDLEFPKLENTRPGLPVALILSYKRSIHIKKKGESSLEKKIEKQNKKKTKIKREN